MKIVFITCFVLTLLIARQSKSETYITSVIHNQPKDLSYKCNFKNLDFSNTLIKSKKEELLVNSLSKLQNILSIDKDKKVSQTIIFLSSVNKNGLININLSNSNYLESDDKKIEKVDITETINRSRNNKRGFVIKVLSLYF